MSDYYNDPSLIDAQKAAETAGTTASNYQSAASLLPQKLREAVMAKVDYNKDIITQQNKAQADYFAAPAQLREKYTDPTSANYIFNPQQAEAIVARDRATAYQPFANLTDILGQRLGSLSDIINAGTGSFNSAANVAAGAANSANTNYSNLLGMAKAKQDQANFESNLAMDKYKADNGGSGGTDSALQALINAILNGGDGGQAPTEEKPTWKYPTSSAASKSGTVHYSPGADWVWDPQSSDWVPAVN